jgi:protein required for attachment to host cells
VFTRWLCVSLTEITPADLLADYSCLGLRRLQARVFEGRIFSLMQATWVVVADPNRATIYAVPRGMARLRQLYKLQPPGPPAKVNHIHGDAGVAAEAEQRPGAPEAVARQFAEHVAEHLEDARLNRRFDELILAADPPFLAHLRNSLSAAARTAVVGEIEKNLVGEPQERLQEHVLRVL